jgi:putative N6-adenine-specific DNA methylase
MAKVELIATSPFGLEAEVAREVKQLGYTEVTVENGSVTFSADETAICRANLWLRTADRVLIQMGKFKATTFDELFEGTKSLPWPDWIPEDATFPVNGKSVKSVLSSVPACQGIVKKAIVEKMKQQYKRSWFDETGPKYTIEVSLLKDVATLTLDTTGPGLHKRGYRKLSAPAPLKETLAAAMISISRWSPERPLLDPFCGSGTIPIEAALIGQNIAPGLRRDFDAHFWPRIPQRLWDKAREEARDLMRRDQKLTIFGSDQETEMISLANYHARSAGVNEGVTFRTLPMSKVRLESEYGCVITNPPYGERLGEKQEVEQLYKDMGNQLRKSLGPTWSYFVITSHPQFESLFAGKSADKRRKLYNGRIQVNLYQYFGPLPPRSNQNPEKDTLTKR